ncbi:AMP-binding protein [Leifsonia sp. NPDC056665]|uniref:AMP-binding protein n=1 Tax=Leifsonia sp. NPDC056665 TaxID=3345901 RepID=UPI0036A66492
MKYDVTPSQRAMVLHQSVHPTDDSFDLAFLWKLQGRIDVSRLDAAVSWVLSEMTAFRTSFSTASGDLVAEVHQTRPRVERIELSTALTEAEAESQLLALMREAVTLEPFGLSSPSQAQCRLAVTPTAVYITLRAAHIAGDAYACYEMLDAMSACYDASESEWPRITARLREHPGSLPVTTPGQATLDSLAELYAHVDSFANANVTAARVGGRFAGRRYMHQISREVVKRLRQSDSYADFGPVAVLYAAYAAMVHRVCGTDRFIIGVPVADRSGVGGKTASGFFVNTLPLPLQVDPTTTWQELLAETRRGLSTLQRARSAYPLTIHHDEACPQVTNQALDNAVTYYKRELKPDFSGIETTSLDVPRSTVSYPIMVTFADGEDTISIELSTAEAYEHADLGAELVKALECIADNPAARIVQPDYRPSAAADDETPLSVETVWRRIQSVATERPTGPAVRAERTLTYRELVDQSRCVAEGLNRAGASHYVVQALPKSADAVVAFLGIMASGRVCVPVDPATPTARLRHIVETLTEDVPGKVTVIAARGGQHPAQEIASADIVLFGALIDNAAEASVNECETDRTAYVIFTSGSTGRPKGVDVGHSGLIPLFDGAAMTMRFTAKDTWIWLHSSNFDYSIWEVFCPLALGATLCIPDEQTQSDPAALAEYVASEKVSVLCETPAGLKRFGRLVAERRQLFSSVRILTVGGETFCARELLAWRTLIMSGMNVFNMYGLTENTIVGTILPMDLVHPDSTTNLIGFPVQSLDAVCLDPYGRIALPGLPGELYLAGVGLARGYLGLPTETSQRFQHLRQPDGTVRRWLATGDRCRDTDLGLAYLGRSDNQVQLRGFRIELGELETTAMLCNGIEFAAAAKIDSPDGPYLALWYAGQASTQTVLDHVRRALPAYMVPAVVEQRSELPTTINGKTDTAALTTALRNRSVVRQPSAIGTAPRDLEGVICEIWTEVTGHPNVMPSSRLFDIGGTSLDAVEITRRLNDLPRPISIDVVDLFEHTTPSELASFIEARERREDAR